MIDMEQCAAGNDGEVHPLDFALAQEMDGILIDAYPGHVWAVSANHFTGVAIIQLPVISMNHGYILHMTQLKNRGDVKNLIVEAGGEILERWSIPRGAYVPGTYSDLAPRRRFEIEH